MPADSSSHNDVSALAGRRQDQDKEDAPPAFAQLAVRISEQELPALGLSLQAVLKATQDDATSGQQIATVVLRDPALTSKVLRAANAAYLGYGGHGKIVTVSRAVVVMGVHAIYELCVAALTIEALGSAREFAPRVQAALARALHAAVQARDLALQRKLPRDAAERRFVEALLAPIGELAFWYDGKDQARALDAALNSGMSPEEAEQEVLGFPLRELSMSLLQSWGLESLAEHSPETTLAVELAEAAQQGWNEPACRQAVQDIGRLLRQDDTHTLARLQQNAGDAAALAVAMGARDIARRLPSAQASRPPAEDAVPPAAEAGEFPVADLRLQLRMLTEMTKVAKTRKELPLLLETCLEGLYRAAGLERAVFCLVNVARTRLAARLAVGVHSEALSAVFDWALGPNLDSLLQPEVLLWLKREQAPNSPLLQGSGAAECLVGSVSVDQKCIGLVYADRVPSRRALDAQAFEAFRGFLEQTEMVARALR